MVILLYFRSILEGEGYADDGREIFDDNDEDEEINDHGKKAKRNSIPQSQSKKKRLNPDIRASESAPLRPSVGRDIRSLFAASSHQSSSKRKKVRIIHTVALCLRFSQYGPQFIHGLCSYIVYVSMNVRNFVPKVCIQSNWTLSILTQDYVIYSLLER